MNSNHAVYCYDFTLGTEFALVEDVKEWLTTNCKKWCFQRELSEECNYEHFQGRFSLKAKLRMINVKEKCPWPEIHLSMTSKGNQSNMFYVSKEESRVDGPWANTDPGQAYVPRHIRKIESLLPFQQTILDMNKAEEDTRTIHCIVNESGNLGKSTFITYCSVKGIATEIPPCNDFNGIMQMVFDLPKVGCYFFDLPKATDKKNLKGLFTGIEHVKDGKAYDPRYHMRQVYFDIPNIFIFTNTYPDLELVSRDRWKIWTINETLQLVPFNSTMPVVNNFNVYEQQRGPFNAFVATANAAIQVNHVPNGAQGIGANLNQYANAFRAANPPQGYTEFQTALNTVNQQPLGQFPHAPVVYSQQPQMTHTQVGVLLNQQQAANNGTLSTFSGTDGSGPH